MNIHKFKHTQLIHEDKKHILDIDNMEKRIKEAGTGPSKDEDMMVVDWLKAYDLYYTFEASHFELLNKASCAPA